MVKENKRDKFIRKLPPDVKSAIWQYFIDHAVVGKNGYLRIMFHIATESDFWQRVYFRYGGAFKRYQKQEKQMQQERSYLYRVKMRGEKFRALCEEIDRNGTAEERAYLDSYRKSRDYLTKLISKGKK